jgi:hypothetical protein
MGGSRILKTMAIVCGSWFAVMVSNANAHEMGQPPTRLSAALSASQAGDVKFVPGPGTGKLTRTSEALIGRAEAYRRRVAFESQIRVVDALFAATAAAAAQARDGS